MSMIGLAIVGKNDEPLYLCDCAEWSRSACQMQTGDVENVSPSEGKDPDDDDPCDPFGFIAAGRSLGPCQNLPIKFQIMMFAALDRLDELVAFSGFSKALNMPRIRNSAPGNHYLDEILAIHEEYRVYGYITSTNIKILALLQSSSNAGRSWSPLQFRSKMQGFMSKVHNDYVSYVMNSAFVKIPVQGTLVSPAFDSKVKGAIDTFYEQPTLPTQLATESKAVPKRTEELA